jgi:DNA-directed RNA polymerase subunit RPC12/RpoP
MSSMLETPKRLIGTYPFRCSECHHRFLRNVWVLNKLKFAKCPKCLGLELTNWPRTANRVKPFYRFLLTLGAHPYRCAVCRLNFVSFRPRESDAVAGSAAANALKPSE